MEKESEVVLFGTWGSSFCTRIALALKLKGIPYEFVEEDLSNKSELLLRYNPVDQKVPVLLHNGIPISESLLILEYIDEQWPNPPKLLPKDPYRRAKVRFWAKFYDERVTPAMYRVLKFRGKEQEKAIEDFSELCKVMEEGIERELFPGKSSFFNDGDELGFLDIAVGTNACCYRAVQEAAAAVIFDPKKHPKILSWVTAMEEHPLMKDTIPPQDKMAAKLRLINSISP